MAKFAAKDSNKNITLSPHGTGKVVVGTGAADATVQSDGNHNLNLQTGNSTTGSITITDGADGAITITPNGTGQLVVGSGSAAGKISSASTNNLVLQTNEGTSTASIEISNGANSSINLKPNGTGFVYVGSGSADGVISSQGTNDLILYTNAGTNSAQITLQDGTNGNIVFSTTGSGEVDIPKVDIDSGEIDGVTLGTNSPVTNAQIDNININGSVISNTATNGTILMMPNGSGTIQLLDGDNNEILIADKSASAVNEITLTNAATGNAPTISASGDDTNIDLNINAKGTGSVKSTSNIIIPDAGNIGSASDTDAIAIASDGGLTFSGGIDNAGTISAGTIGGGVAMQNGLTLRNQEYKQVTAISKTGTGAGGATTEFTVGTFTYTPKFGNLSGGSEIVFEAQFFLEVDNDGGSDSRGYIEFDISGSGITNFTWNSDNYSVFGGFDRGASGVQFRPIFRAQTAFISASTNDTITSVVKCRMTAGSGDPKFYLYSQSSASFNQSYVKFMEFK